MLAAAGPRLHVVALAAGEAGLATLRGLLSPRRPLVLSAVFTHRRRPKALDPARSADPAYAQYADLARVRNLPLHTADDRWAAERLDGLSACRPFDVLLTVGWRYPVPGSLLTWPRLAAIELHHGPPSDAGVDPIRRALEAGEKSLTITARLLTSDPLPGPVLIERSHRVGLLRGPTLADDVERVQRELFGLYPQVAIQAIERVAGPVLAHP